MQIPAYYFTRIYLYEGREKQEKSKEKSPLQYGLIEEWKKKPTTFEAKQIGFF